MAEFDKATRPEPTERPGHYTILLDEQWSIGPKLHGGYLLAVLARAARAAIADERPDHTCPQAVTGTFLRAPEPGPATMEVTVLRLGRGASQLRVRLDQDGPAVEAACVLGPPAALSPDDHEPGPPELTAVDDCPRSPTATDDGRGSLPIMGVVDTRLDPRTTGFLRGRPSGEGRVAGWVSLDSGEPWTPEGLLVALDILPPATFDMGLAGWSPTMSLSAHVVAAPVPGPLRVVQWVERAGTDRMHETCRVWDPAGRLVGHAHQLAAIRR
jgi:acyl-Coa thioesterase superfamily protein/acyl-CoA thioesterase superfamily protein